VSAQFSEALHKHIRGEEVCQFMPGLMTVTEDANVSSMHPKSFPVFEAQNPRKMLC
jgi:hypothetical protein